MRTYVYTHICIHLHIHLHVYICTHIYTHTHIYMYTYTNIFIHTCMYIHTYIYIYIYNGPQIQFESGSRNHSRPSLVEHLGVFENCRLTAFKMHLNVRVCELNDDVYKHKLVCVLLCLHTYIYMYVHM